MEEKKKNNLVWLLIILIIVITTSIGLVYNHANKNVVVQNEKLTTNSLSENELATRNEKIKDYIKSIYPLPIVESTYENVTFPIFNTIEEANKDWILSVAYNNITEKEEGYVDKIELEMMTNELFRKVNINIEDYLKEGRGFYNNNGKYYWLGQEGGIDTFSDYLIKSIKEISNNTFEVEIVECISEGIWTNEGEVGKRLIDINGNKLEEIMYDEATESNDYIENHIKDYLEKNINKLPTKILTIEYNENDGRYFILSSKF